MTIRLRPKNEMTAKSGQSVLMLDTAGYWSVVQVNTSWSWLKGARLEGRVADEQCYDSPGEYAELVTVPFDDVVGWIDLADLPTTT